MQVVGQAYMDLNTTYYASYVSLAPRFGLTLTAMPAVGLTARRLASSVPACRSSTSC